MSDHHKSDVFMLGPVDMTLRPPTQGPYRVTEMKWRHREPDYCVTGKHDAIICSCSYRHDAERIAYCLNLVEESEETDRKGGV